MPDKKQVKRKRDVPIQVFFSKQEVKDIEEGRDFAGMSKSEFIRQSVFDKIRRIKHPEVFNSAQIDLNGIKEELSEKIDEKMDIYADIFERVIETMKSINIVNESSKEEADDMREKLRKTMGGKKKWA